MKSMIYVILLHIGTNYGKIISVSVNGGNYDKYTFVWK